MKPLDLCQGEETPTKLRMLCQTVWLDPALPLIPMWLKMTPDVWSHVDIGLQSCGFPLRSVALLCACVIGLQQVVVVLAPRRTGDLEGLVCDVQGQCPPPS